MSDNDPIEFIGRERGIKADHVPAPIIVTQVDVDVDVDVEPVAIVEPVIIEPVAVVEPVAVIVQSPVKKPSHPKIAKLRPRLEYEKAQIETTDARLEYQAASIALRSAEKMEGEALASLISILPRPSQDDVLREKLANEQAARLERVNAGLPPEAPIVQKVGKSPIDQFAANRGRSGTRVPLRSSVTRR